ncbi:MAG: response regulator [Candidatus Omnitrophica bacterium]|nr:response regulator [Candidatus Omnitrophota bacterium]
MVKKKVLIIDDEVDFTEILKLNLELTGKYEIKIENNSSHGLETAKKFKPDVILLDILMPHINGYKVLDLLKKDEDTISIPVIMLSAITTEEAKVISAGLYDESFIEKPISVKILEEKLDKVLGRFEK